jgi:hypothetical protein
MRAACRVAASVLTKAALERGSRDNITVVLVGAGALFFTGGQAHGCVCVCWTRRVLVGAALPNTHPTHTPLPPLCPWTSCHRTSGLRRRW